MRQAMLRVHPFSFVSIMQLRLHAPPSFIHPFVTDVVQLLQLITSLNKTLINYACICEFVLFTDLGMFPSLPVCACFNALLADTGSEC